MKKVSKKNKKRIAIITPGVGILTLAIVLPLVLVNKDKKKQVRKQTARQELINYLNSNREKFLNKTDANITFSQFYNDHLSDQIKSTLTRQQIIKIYLVFRNNWGKNE